MKNYLRFLSPVMLLLMAVMFGGGKILAQNSETYNFSKFTSAKTVTLSGIDCTITLKKNDGSNAPTWNTNKKEARVYAKGSLTVSSKKLIKKIVFNYKSNSGTFGSVTPSGYNKSNKTWSSESGSNTVTFTMGGTSGNFGFTSLDITYEDDGKTQTTLSFPTPSYTYEAGQDNGTAIIDNNAAVLKDKEGNVISDATGKITYSVVPEDVAFCDNKNPSIIWVDTSKEGTATVTATFDAAGTDEKYSTSTATYTIKVTKRQTTLSFGEAYDGKTINVNLGDEFTAPTATLTPNIEGATIKYSSNNSAVANVDETTGAVTIVGAGTTVITADFVGDDTYGASTASYTINVVKAATVEDGVFDFTGTLDYGSGLEPTNDNNAAMVEASTWKAVNVTINTLKGGGNGIRWWTNKDGSNVLRVYKSSKLAISVPTGYVITNIDLGIWGSIEADCGKLNNSKWTGSSQIVTLTMNERKDFKNITVKYAETLTTSAKGYATYSADYAVNYSELGLTAYTLTVDESKKTVTAKEFTGVVPAGGAVLVKGTESTAYTLTPATTEGDATFVTALQTGAIKADGTQYGFTSKSGTPAFAQVQSGQEIPAKKGYIVL